MSVKQYDINWEKIKTIKDLKKVVSILATRIVINHDDEEDQVLFENLENILTETKFDPEKLNPIDDEIVE